MMYTIVPFGFEMELEDIEALYAYVNQPGWNRMKVFLDYCATNAANIAVVNSRNTNSVQEKGVLLAKAEGAADICNDLYGLRDELGRLLAEIAQERKTSN